MELLTRRDATFVAMFVGIFVNTPVIGQEKPININLLGGTVLGTNRNRAWDKRDPSLGQSITRPWDKPAVSVEFHSKIAILSRLSLGQVGVCRLDDCPARAVGEFVGHISLSLALHPSHLSVVDVLVEIGSEAASLGGRFGYFVFFCSGLCNCLGAEIPIKISGLWI